jgi:hypothetical protein
MKARSREYERHEIAAMLRRYNKGEPAYKLAAEYGCSHARMCRILRLRGADMRRNESCYEPTPEEIEERKAEIRRANEQAIQAYCPPDDDFDYEVYD